MFAGFNFFGFMIETEMREIKIQTVQIETEIAEIETHIKGMAETNLD